MPGGAPKGNRNSAKGRRFAETVERALDQLVEGDKRGRTKLQKACEELADAAANGEVWALQMAADRLDGKAHQSMSVKDESPLEDLDAGSLASIIPIIRALIARERESTGSDGNGVIH